MSEETWTGRATDEELADIARDGTLAILGGNDDHRRGGLKDIAAELIRLRRIVRGDSRRAEQLKKLRWSAETLIAKIEKYAGDHRNEEALAIVRLALAGCSCVDKGCVHAHVREAIGLAP